MTNFLACEKAHLFRAAAPISSGFVGTTCKPSNPISYISMCGSVDDEAHCQDSVASIAQRWSKLLKCTGAGGASAPVVRQMSATTKCTQWDACAGGNFVETCMTEGLAHNVSGHLRPDGTSFRRPGSDLDFPVYMFQKFSLLADRSFLFYGHPTAEELTSNPRHNFSERHSA